MSRNVETFTADKLDEVDEAIRETSVDLIIVRKLLDLSLEDYTQALSNVIGQIEAFTPNVEADWNRHRSHEVPQRLRPTATGVLTPSITPHIDPSLIGYAVSINRSKEDREFFATRQIDVPDFRDAYGAVDVQAALAFNQSPSMIGIIGEDDWSILHPGDAAVFGEYPNPAIHASRSKTCDVTIVGWEEYFSF